MKFFKQKKAMTLTELVIAVMVWAVILVIIFNFVADNGKELQDSRERTWVFQDIFKLKDDLNKKTRWWYYVGTWIIDLDKGVWYDVLMLTNDDSTKGYLYWVVDTNTMKLDWTWDYDIYWDKVIWYRSLSKNEITEISSNPNKVYEKKFFKDKLYPMLFSKDFQVDYYNTWTILDLNLTIWSKYLPSLDWTKISSVIKKDDLIKFNLDF